MTPTVRLIYVLLGLALLGFVLSAWGGPPAYWIYVGLALLAVALGDALFVDIVLELADRALAPCDLI